MLEIRLLGQFDLRLNGQPIEISSRPAQSLFAYLLVKSGTTQRREKLAGMFWPNATEANARGYLRQASWRIRKALELSDRDYLLTDDLTVAFDASMEYWLDVAVLEQEVANISAEELLRCVSVYHGEFLPGFYDEWVDLERERLQAIYEHKMTLLLDRLVIEQRWSDVLEWGERWIALGHVPEPACCPGEPEAVRSLQDLQGISETLLDLGSLVDNKDYGRACAYLQESLGLCRAQGDVIGVANALNILGLMALRQGDFLQARRWLEESLAVQRPIGDDPFILLHLGELALRQGDYAQARAYYEQNLSVCKEHG